jgi:hypothetical protein
VIRLRFDIWEFESHKFRIETRDIDGAASMNTVEGTIQVTGVGNSTAVSHLVFTITNLKFVKPGLINFILFIDGKETASIPLYLRQG